MTGPTTVRLAAASLVGAAASLAKHRPQRVDAALPWLLVWAGADQLEHLGDELLAPRCPCPYCDGPGPQGSLRPGR